MPTVVEVVGEAVVEMLVVVVTDVVGVVSAPEPAQAPTKRMASKGIRFRMPVLFMKPNYDEAGIT